MIHYAHRHGTRTLLINARLSDKSARGYRKIAPLVRATFDDLDAVAVQSDSHGERFLSLGLPADKLSVAGSIKFDIRLPEDLDQRAAAIREKTGGRRVLLAASTHSGEEEIVLEQYIGLAGNNILLVLAPRHPHRAAEVEQLCKAKGLRVVRHSQGIACDSRTSVLLLDTMGELMYFYRIAYIAFVGGSLVPIGGHNPMEPASVDVPIIMGPHLHNIDDIASEFVDAGAMIVVRDASGFGQAVQELLCDETKRNALVTNANRVMDANRGALDRVQALIEGARVR